MGVPEAVKCPECGTTTKIDLIQDRFEGFCPGCLAAVAVEATPAPIQSPRSLTSAMPPEAAQAPASARLGKFVLVTLLGAGGSGEVWKAWDMELDRWVALKIFHQEDPDQFSRYKREAQTAARISHPGIAAIYEVGEEDGRRFIAMQFMEGATLDKVDRHNRRVLARVIRDAARAVGAAHELGIVHRDLKPANIAVQFPAKKPDELRVTVLDFGLARKIEGSERLTLSGVVVGTPAYMPPEQARGEPLDGRADVYALGATLYQLLTGRPVFQGSNVYEILKKLESQDPRAPRRIVPVIERDLETIVVKCLEKDRGRRYATADELADDLDRWLKGRAIHGHPPSLWYRLRRFVAARKTAFGSVAAALLVALGVAGYSALHRLGENRARDRARGYVEAGRRIVDQMRVQMRDPYKIDDLRKMAERAEGEYRKALDQLPELPEAHLGIGTAWRLAKDTKRAHDALRKSLAAAPEFATAHLDLARLLAIAYEDLKCPHNSRPDPEKLRRMRADLETHLRQVEAHTRDNAERLFAVALLAMDRDYRRTVEVLSQYLEVAPGDPDGHEWQGHALFHLGRHTEAIVALTRALTCDTGNAAAYDFRGGSKRLLGRLVEAIDDHSKAIELAPPSAACFNNRGNARYDLKLYDDAIKDYERALALNRNLAYVWNNRGAAKDAKGLHDDAISDFNSAIQLDPTVPEFIHNRGRARNAKGNIEGAVEDWKETLRLNPKYAEAYFALGNVHWKKGEFAPARKQYEEVLKLNPKHEGALINRGIIRNKTGDPAGALADLNAAVENNPASAFACVQRAQLRQDQGDLDGAIADYTAALSIDSSYADAYNDRATAYEAKGSYTEALADCEQAVRLGPSNPLYLFSRSQIRRMTGNLDGSLEDLNRVLNLDPRHLGARYNRGIFHSMRGHPEGAIADWTKALEVDPNHVDSRGNRGLAYYRTGRFEEAKADFDAAIGINPRETLVYLNRSLVLVKMGQPKAALADLEEALKIDRAYAPAYKTRGWLRYDLGEWPQALADFREACAAGLEGHDEDYVRFAIWFVESRSGDKLAALDALKDYASGRKRGEGTDWPRKILYFLIGGLSEESLFKLGEAEDAREKDRGHSCEAYFYAGMKRLIEADKSKAREYFKKCLATGVTSFLEYGSAAVELKRLGDKD